MHDFFEKSREILERIRNFEEKVVKFANLIKNRVNLVERVSKTDLGSLTICGVDGGLIKKSFHGIDLVLTRAVGVIFKFEEGRLKDVIYYPSRNPTPNLQIFFDPISEFDFELEASLVRSVEELKVAIDCVKKFKIDMLMLDGSLIPPIVFQEKANLELTKLKEFLLELFKVCKEKNCCLVGIVKDSRGRRFCEVVSKIFEEPEQKVMLERMRDTHLLSYLLDANEKTVALNYSSDPSSIPILSELEDPNSLKVFYLKSSEFERPLRIEFLSNSMDSKKIASIILSLIIDPNYCIPSILIEADQIARLRKEEIDLLHAELFSSLMSFGLLRRRRERRLF